MAVTETRRDTRKTGLHPLAYVGVEPIAPPLLLTNNRAPTSEDRKNFNVGTVWVNRATAPLEEIWMLVNLDAQVARWLLLSAGGGELLTLTGNNTGVVVPGDVNHNIFVQGSGPYIITGNAVTWALTLADDGTIATTYTTDVGNAIPAGNIINIFGGTGIGTTGAGNTVTVNVDGSVATQYDADVGSATPVSNVLNILGGTAIGTVAAGNTITINADGSIATQYDCDVGSAVPVTGVLNVVGGTAIDTAGAGNTVTINADGSIATQYDCDTGSAVPVAGVLNVLGGIGCDTTGAGNTVTVATSSIVAIQYDADVGSAVPAAAVLNVAGGDNINTAAAGNTVTVHLNETIHWPNTNAAGTSGMIYFGGASGIGGTRIFHNYGTQNLYVGTASGNLTLTGSYNTGFGNETFENVTSGSINVGVGTQTLERLTIGDRNTGVGEQALRFLTTGDNNTGVGNGALIYMLTGNYNTAIGPWDKVGSLYTTNESSNVIVCHVGVAGEDNTMHLGTHGSGNAEQNRCFIAGVRGITTGVGDAIPVLIDSAYQLGTVSSSIRFKQQVKDMEDVSNGVMDLRPVTFEFKSHPGILQYGLIAEEVEKIMPRLVVKDAEGVPDAVKYHELPVLLLNEIKKLKARIEVLENR